MNITVIGAGYVGLVVACCLASSGNRVICVETDRDKLAILGQGKAPIREEGIDELLSSCLQNGSLSFQHRIPRPLVSELAIVAVGTPSLPDGATDLSAVHEVVKGLRDASTGKLTLLMKSTVPPGTGIRLIRRYLDGTEISYVSNPEFLREGQAVKDWYYPSRIVIGTNEAETADRVRRLYEGIDAPKLITGITSAETIKYAANAFLATKISFINEIANLCEVVGARVDDVSRGIGLDPRIGPDFLNAGLGYGGSCFPKDTRALNLSALSNGYDFRLLKSTIEVNGKQAIMAVRKMHSLLNGLDGRDIALLGLSFKPDTDDIRESPALNIASLLCEHDVRLRVYDPVAMANARPFLREEVIMSPDLYSAIEGAQGVILATDWSEFVKADWARIKKSMTVPHVIFDGRNALPQEEIENLGFRYSGTGR